MIFISLFFDGLTNATQDTMIKKNKQITGSHLMVISNGCIFFWNLTYLLLFDKTQLEKSLQVLNQDSPDILKLLLIYSICGALGQVFIFYSLQSFGSIILIMVTVTRKMISMILSIVVYEHKLNGPQIAGIGIVFCGISYEAIMKHKKGSRGINKSSLREKKQE
ncbi:uncharacterized protein SCODWIG_00222 [Saccharomycodes ludwigii]|uniref:UDP-galactose transporter homolog 1 n=2 Tax=Saccharomycodes ludwigii TaxID=36035 RepID=A0A376B1E1_9ASCO|nr:uncharacterized protein SCODWIG_00222 [Saccharomycodes ludwigii]